MVSFRRAKVRRPSGPLGSGPPGLPVEIDPTALLQRHASTLAAAARDIHASFADADVAGVIVTPGASHGDTLRLLLAECHGDADRGHVCIGIVPGERLRTLLRDRRLEERTEPLLIVVIDTPSGVRIGAVPWEAGGEAHVPK